jgi:hypothetical protein
MSKSNVPCGSSTRESGIFPFHFDNIIVTPLCPSAREMIRHELIEAPEHFPIQK